MTELSLHILDIVQNSIKAGADLIEVTVNEDMAANLLVIEINDNGCGMEEDFLKDVVNPFRTTRTTRKVGLGLSLFKNACELTGGNLDITSKVGVGTKVKATFVHNSIDRQPLGDMASTMATIIGGHDQIDYIYVHSINNASFEFSTKEIRKVLGEEVELSNLDVLNWIEGYIAEQEENLNGGAI
ncbi:MAG: ATP-binding protein [Firmicutes bacterium]|nr:ATP-binding protein [Bacillota bacterium]